ncbi:virulence factor Mce family protein [Haloechinothrix alba]|uniref:Virulence factor Mce family protein n=1 Tax=Haloechinothrix alba TaxID=664784 RepID=A0A238YHI7_9PSEU|nr:MCE family protein [Haloechinothrix alba]SNR70597.1 virulence factor Mce family protein [Haloechinothrix alba]
MSLRTLGSYLSHGLTRWIAIACVLGLVVAGGVWWLQQDGEKTATAFFPAAIGLYEGNTVRVLGVDMGTVEAVEPVGDRVKVTMSYHSEVDIPADAKAVIVAPSLVSDRYVQFTPAYTGGPVLEDGAMVPQERTAVPLEIDDLYESTNRLADALGPEGANEDGSLSNLISTLAENMDGQGENFNETITKMGQLSETLSGSSEELFGTVRNLAEFTSTLADSDEEVRRFEEQLADISGFLADERENLGAMVEQLGVTLDMVQRFIEDNHEEIRSNVDKLADVTQVLVEQRAALAEFMDVAPTALNNVINSYNATGGTLDARGNFNELTMSPFTLACYLVDRGPEELEAAGAACDELTGPLQGRLPSPGEMIETMQQGELPLPSVDEFSGPTPQGGGQ